MPSVIIGKDAETGQVIRIDDIERRSGLYILGRMGRGKTTFIKKLIEQDMENGHGVFFLDPHGDAIEDLQKRIPAKRQNDVIILDPLNQTYSFGINLLACPDPDNMIERSRTFAQAIDIFKKLFANPQTEELDILLNQYLRNSFFPLIANQDCTIAEIPLFLEEKQFRDRLLQNPSIRPEVVRFWHNTFDRMPSNDQREEIASTRRRLDHFGDFDEIRHIVGQSKTTIDFTDIMNTGKILFVKLSKTLPGDAWRIIGTILISNLVHAVLQREQLPEEKRRHFCIFVDEFQNFASSDDFAVLFTQARKYAIATTIAHQERYGQFADNKRIAGATDAAVIKIFFQVTPHDAREQAVEFAKEATTTETRLEPELVITQEPLNDLLRRGHANPRIQELVNSRLRPIQRKLEQVRDKIEGARIERAELIDQATIYQDHAAIDRISAQIEGVGYAPGGIDSLAQSMSAIDNAMAFHTQARNVTEDIKAEFQDYQEIKDSIHRINRHLNALMEGRLSPEPGDEEYVDLFMNVLFAGYDVDVPLRGVYFLYLQLRFGKPNLPRSIPPFLAMKYFWEELVKEYRQIHTQRYEEVRKKSGNSPIPSFDELQALSPLEEDVLCKERVIINYHEKPYVLDMLFQSRMFKLDFQFQLRRFLDKNKDTGLPLYLPQLPYRVLSRDEIERLTKLCYTELLHDPVTGQKRIEKLLFAGIRVKRDTI